MAAPIPAMQLLGETHHSNPGTGEVRQVQSSLRLGLGFGSAVALSILIAGSASMVATAQQRGARPAASTSAGSLPRTSWDGKPDLTGVWQGAKLTPRAYGLVELEQLYQPSAKATMKTLSEKDDPVLRCVVYGYPRRMATAFPIQILQAVGTIVLFDNRPHIYRYIPTDGRSHTDDLFPSYQGDSVGRWDGDTLVVDVNTFNGRIWLAGAKEHPTATLTGAWITSDAMHLVERWHLLDANTLEYQATVEDPKVLTGPWTTPKISLKRASVRKLEDEGHCIPEGIDYQAAGVK